MRIAVLTLSRRRIAGVESYLSVVLPALGAAGHHIAVVSEIDEPTGADLVFPAPDADWCAQLLGADRVVAETRRWEPDVLYCHGMNDAGFEAALQDLAPTAFFAHNYYGTCISGLKSYETPVPRPCSRVFGLACLLQYYPRRCGGLSPVTMAHDYRRQAARLRLLRRHPAVITHSQRMLAEYRRHGISPDRLHLVPYCAEVSANPLPRAPRRLPSEGPLHLSFIGRMTSPKGGDLLLRALPLVQAALRRDIHLTFAGDGPARKKWEEGASRLHAHSRHIHVTFTGWVDRQERDELLDRTDLLVVPSVWPEPLGLVGIEAGARGVPAAAFDVGGIPEWLEDGVNGFLAPGDPPTYKGLASAIVEGIRDERIHARLRKGAIENAAKHTVSAHLAALEPLLSSLQHRNTAAIP